MGTTDWTFSKPYDLRERLLEFACVIVRLVQYLRTRGPVASALSEQVLKAGTSAGANYEESDDASSPRDKLAKRRIALRELKETNFRLRTLRQTNLLTPEHDPVIQESAELIRILATIIRRQAARDASGRSRRER